MREMEYNKLLRKDRWLALSFNMNSLWLQLMITSLISLNYSWKDKQGRKKDPFKLTKLSCFSIFSGHYYIHKKHFCTSCSHEGRCMVKSHLLWSLLFYYQQHISHKLFFPRGTDGWRKHAYLLHYYWYTTDSFPTLSQYYWYTTDSFPTLSQYYWYKTDSFTILSHYYWYITDSFTTPSQYYWYTSDSFPTLSQYYWYTTDSFTTMSQYYWYAIDSFTTLSQYYWYTTDSFPTL